MASSTKRSSILWLKNVSRSWFLHPMTSALLSLVCAERPFGHSRSPSLSATVQQMRTTVFSSAKMLSLPMLNYALTFSKSNANTVRQSFYEESVNRKLPAGKHPLPRSLHPHDPAYRQKERPIIHYETGHLYVLHPPTPPLPNQIAQFAYHELAGVNSNAKPLL